MTRRACICVGGLLAIIVLWLFVRDNAVPPLGYEHLIWMGVAWVSGLCVGYFTDVKEKQEQESHGDPRHDR